MKIFLDVGAHVGQTLSAVLRWKFDRIVCFEPARVNVAHLLEIADARTVIEPFGLWNESATKPLYNIGSQGASLWKRPKRPTTSEKCSFIRASDWFMPNISPEDTVFMKLNAEGAELDVLEDLLDSGAFALIDYLLVMWDARKIPALQDRLAAVQARVMNTAYPIRVLSSKDVPPAVSHIGRIDNWLKLTGAVERL